ncbi:MAG: hypothetical protein CMI29_06820 [Opitutae bacterium]|nr:hypothetical protein [Opitutae bacterium]|tara:strand:+ start:1571 stop:2566 length:996 start_codon:yes stop_codon:yes gene_type:complete
MGHQSYAVPFDDAEQLAWILDIVKKHNACSSMNGATHQWVRYDEHEAFTQLKAGTDLRHFVVASFKMNRQYKSPRDGPSLSRVLLFDNDGGRNSTFAFLQWHLMRALPNVYVDGFHAVAPYMYDEDMEARLAMNRAKDVFPTMPKALPIAVRPAEFITRTIKGNDAFRFLVMGFDRAERKKRMREEPDVPPYVTTYTTVIDGLVVDDARYTDAQRDEAEAHAQRLCLKWSEAAATASPIARDRADIETRNLARFEAKRDAGMDYWRLENGGRFWLTPEEVAERRGRGEKYTKATIKWQTLDKAYSEEHKHSPVEEIERMIDAGKKIVLFGL